MSEFFEYFCAFDAFRRGGAICMRGNVNNNNNIVGKMHFV